MTFNEIVNNPATKFVDVRTPMEYESGHVEGAFNIPLDQFAYRYNEIEGLGQHPVVFYCRSGGRSSQAVSYLMQMGIRNIYNGGGIDSLRFELN